MTVTIYRERIPSTDPRCRRHILHDSRSWAYEFDTAGLEVASVEHERTLPILDQGAVGSCTAECGTGILGTAPYSGDQAVGVAFTAAFGSWDQAGAYRVYSAEELLDGDGPYPPQDHGSTGLTLAKVLRAVGCISGWMQTFSLAAALKALTRFPLATGTYWYNSMFIPSPEGVLTVDPSSGVAGGHEYEVVGYDATRGLVKLANSWGTSWGASGYGYMQAEDWGGLLDRQGDVTIFTPLSQPAPAPTPTPGDPDTAFAGALRHHDWIHHPHLPTTAHVASAARVWLAKKGL